MRSELILCFITAIIMFILGTWYWWMERETPEGEMVHASEHVWYSRDLAYARAIIFWFVGLFLLFLGLANL